MAQKKQTYQQLQQELDNVLADLQSSELDIDEAVKAYERGMAIVKQLEGYLEDAQNKVTKIKQSFDS